MFNVLKLAVAASGLFSVVVLTVMLMRTFAFSQKPMYAQPRGSSFAGVMYAFGWGMLPWEKESAAKHIWTYFGGVLYHISIFVALLFLITILLDLSFPTSLVFITRLLLAIGLFSGAALLIKRIFKLNMKALSSRDDYWANLLVDLLLLSALMASFSGKAGSPFLILAIITFIYIPFGKLRHCVFFFYSRILFGDFFGRRGVLPHLPRKN